VKYPLQTKRGGDKRSKIEDEEASHHDQSKYSPREPPGRVGPRLTRPVLTELNATT
jgi:hypothetical protein